MSRWFASLQHNAHLMGLLSALLLTLAVTPFGQWYLALLALTPWLIAVDQSTTYWAALLAISPLLPKNRTICVTTRYVPSP